MSGDRDNRTPKTPPPGVLAQLAKPESWEGQHTGVTPVRGVPAVGGEAPVETLVRRSGETKNMVADVSSEVELLKTRVTGIETQVAAVKQAVDEQGRQNNTIIGMTGDVISILKSRERVTETVTITEAEIKKTRALTDNELTLRSGLVAIDDDKLARAARRERAKKIFERFVLPILVAAATYIAIKLGA